MGPERGEGGVSAPFEADLDPETGAPRLRFNFDNGWSASVVLTTATRDRCHFFTASVAACPVGQWGKGKTQLLDTEIAADEVACRLDQIRRRDRP